MQNKMEEMIQVKVGQLSADGVKVVETFIKDIQKHVKKIINTEVSREDLLLFFTYQYLKASADVPTDLNNGFETSAVH